MKLNTKQFKEACQSILAAIDNKSTTLFTETLELVANGKTLSLNVTNREYFCTSRFSLGNETTFKAAVNAVTFLSLIGKITSDEVEITIDEAARTVKVKGNGNYKLPLIYDDDKLVELPRIDIETLTNSMSVNGEILQSILMNNSKELQRGVPVRPVQKYYYVDNQGCITFTSGACVNSFTLPQDVKLLLSEKVVKLFKLFKGNALVGVEVGTKVVSPDITQTIVRFSVDSVTLTAILPETSLIDKVPVAAIRERATKDYTYSAILNRVELLQAINRLMIFNGSDNYGVMEFSDSSITIRDWSKENEEQIIPLNGSSLGAYTACVNLNGLALILSGNTDDQIVINFGDSKAIVFKKTDITDILPELRPA